MAFALTKFMTYGIDMAGPNKKRGLQRATMTISGLPADVALDLGNNSGTFWTFALINPTYGELARKALDVLQRIETNAEALLRISSEQLLGRTQAGAPAGTSYTLTVAGKRPNITFAANQGAFLWVLDIEWLMNDSIFPIVSSFG